MRRARIDVVLGSLAILLGLLSACLGASSQALAQDAPTTTACLECHGVDGARPAGQALDGTSVYLDNWNASVHAMLECTDCHASLQTLPHDVPLPKVDCSSCHAEETDVYLKSAHGLRAAAGDSLAPSCIQCHNPHEVRSAVDPLSTLHRARQAALCTGCHGDAQGAGARTTSVPHPAQSYSRGAHAQAMEAGNDKAATCADCHDSHAVHGADDPTSSIFPRNVPATCGKCHQEEFAAYDASAHNTALQQGASGSPACNTCHGEHAVLNLGEEGLSTIVASETCESCHNSPALARRYDLPQGAVASYEDSYHGRAARGGLASAAGCTSCHGVHRILPATDPTSSIHPANLLTTCNRCHTLATPEFAASYAHTPNGTSTADRGAATVRSIYAWLIGIVIGGMLLHNLVLFAHDVRQRWLHHRRHATHERLNRNERIQHTVLFVTFFLLVLSGFALKYDQVFWSRWLSEIGMTEGVRRIVHRTAAVGMIAAALYHLVWLGSRRGREQIGYMLPRPRDVRELVQNIGYHLGRTRVPPAFARFRYIEKAEYWALIWGTVVMAATGLVLWFPDQLRGPTWFLRVVEAIHLYEAWLALLAVVVWHFFFVMFRPGTFPVSFTFVTGRMEPEELEHEHPEEYRAQYPHEAQQDQPRPPS